MVLRLCCVTVITAVCAMILKVNKPEYVPMCLTAGGIMIVLFGFDYFAAGMQFIEQFTKQTGIDSSAVRLVLKVIGVGYLIEITAGAVKDLGFDSLSDKLIMCGKFIIFIMSVPVLESMFSVILKFADGV